MAFNSSPFCGCKDLKVSLMRNFHIFTTVCWITLSLDEVCWKNFSYLWKFFLQFHDRGGPGSWRQPQCWENFKISLFVPSFFRSCLEVPAPAFLKQSFITFEINISLYFSHFAVFSVHFCCCSNYRAFGAPCHAGLHRVTPSHAYIVPPIRFLH